MKEYRILKTSLGENQYGNYWKFVIVVDNRLTIITIYENDAEWRRITFTDGVSCIQLKDYTGPLITEGPNWVILKVELNQSNIP